MEEVYVCKVSLDNIPNQSITIYSQWNTCSFSLKIIHSNEAWGKNVSSDSVKLMSEFTQYKPTEYIVETKRALATNGGAKDFTYTLIDSEFTWKKIVDNDQNIRVKFGSLHLEKDSVSCVGESIIDFMIRRGVSAEKRSDKLEEENIHLKKVNSNLRTQVDELVSLKKEMEENLYTKFILLLNSKKEKILEIEQMLNEHKNDTLGHSSKTRQKISKEDIYGSETDIDSDSEKPDLCLPKKEQKDEYGSETELDTEDENLGPSTSKIQKLGPPSLPLHSEYKFEDVSDDSTTPQSNFKDEFDETFEKDTFLPVRPKKNATTRFSSKSRVQTDVGASLSKKQKDPVTNEEGLKSQLLQTTKPSEVKCNLSIKKGNSDYYDAEDLLSDF